MKGIKLIDIPFAEDSRGFLSVVEQGKEIPFEIKRVFWIYGVAEKATRASHAHKELSQFIVAPAGSFKVTLDDGEEREEFQIDSPVKGLLIPRGVWISITDFSKDAVCMVAAPGNYDLDEYITDYDRFLKWKKEVSD